MATSNRPSSRSRSSKSEVPVSDITEETVTNNNDNTETPVVEEPVADVVETPAVEEEQPKSRIPDVLAQQAMLNSICEKYLGFVDEIAAYNKEVLAAKSSEWNSTKVLERARAMGRPTTPGTEPDADVAKALSEWEDLVNQMNLAKRKVVDITANKLGISLTVTAERDTTIEAPLKEKRGIAQQIGKQLAVMADMFGDQASINAIKEFLAANELPQVGRDASTSFTEGGKPTPKYRVTVEVKKGENALGTFDGFTKTAIQLSKPEYGYARGKSLDAETLRKVWENAGNSPENTVQNPVVFEDDSVDGEALTYTITKKQ